MEFDFLQPIKESVLTELQSLSSQHLASKVVFHSKENFPVIEKIQVAIIGVLDARGNSLQNQEVDLTEFRKQFYSLYPGNWMVSIADIGDIYAGETINDTYYALQSIISSLIKKKIIPIIIGGSQDLTYALYRSYDHLEQMVNLVSIDNKFDFGKPDESNPSESYLSKIVIDEPNNLFNYTNIGYQTYYNSQEEIDLMDKMYFDGYRLGEISNNIELSEPVLRDADCVSIDLSSVKSSDSGSLINFQPNGFNGKEICSLSRYSGISDKVTLFGIFNHNCTSNEAVLISQIVWYFIEGVHYRSNEYPFGSKDDYIRYIIPYEDQELVFYKSNKSDRWWLEMQTEYSKTNNKIQKRTLLPCSYDEYIQACNHEFPERWWKFQRKCML